MKLDRVWRVIAIELDPLRNVIRAELVRDHGHVMEVDTGRRLGF